MSEFTTGGKTVFILWDPVWIVHGVGLWCGIGHDVYLSFVRRSPFSNLKGRKHGPSVAKCQFSDCKCILYCSPAHTTNQLTQMATEALTDAISIFSAKKLVVAPLLSLYLPHIGQGKNLTFDRHLFNGLLLFTFTWRLSVNELLSECVSLQCNSELSWAPRCPQSFAY